MAETDTPGTTFLCRQANPSPVVVKLLAHLGAGFDCASQAEIDLVLAMGVTPSRIVFANPCKQNSVIHFANSKGVEMMTFDNEVELQKIKEAFPRCRLLLRILPKSGFRQHGELGNKFGCHLEDVPHLLLKAQQLQLNVIGISFNVGTGVMEPEAYSAAIQMAAKAFDMAKELGFCFQLLDIGGGFLGCSGDAEQFERTAKVVNEALQKYFPPERNIRLIAEPGTYFVASAFTLAVNVIGKRLESRDTPDQQNHMPGKCHKRFRYFLNDGVYGSFLNFLLTRTLKLTFEPLHTPANSQRFTCSLWGPTCDGLDLIRDQVDLPEMKVGDYLCVRNMGYYTITMHSGFNGMPMPEVFLYCAEDIWLRVFPERKVPIPQVFLVC
ncbi:ornithine decarboxylase-like [Pomacea canaliculata]|uniref:ornithine decarboxylase-like n=1 Tax=Pomacea canaliculata TaxID=400727 RepID=UPI000D72D9DB|nr:ornithine decarboxylase-like [Pomacea canaliculata]